MKCYLVGDMGRGSKGQYQVGKAMKQRYMKDKVQFVVGLGDNIYEDGAACVDDIQFQLKFEKPYACLPDDTWYMCLGNHDYGYTPDGNDEFIDNSMTQVKYTNHSKKWTMPKKYYTFVRGDAEFFVLDTNLDRFTKQSRQKQLKYMKQKLDSSKQRWKIIIGHHTWRSVASHGNSEIDGFEDFLSEMFKDTKPHLYMGGHDHCMSLMVKDGITIVICGTGCDEYYKEEPITLENMNDCRLDYFSPSQGYASLDITPKQLTLEFYNKHNYKEYKHIIR